MTSGIAVPSSIDATGATNAAAALQTWINGLPTGSTLVFAAGATYRLDTGLRLNKALTVEGNGSTLKMNGDYSDFSTALVVQATNVTIRNFKVAGNSPSPGVYIGGQEQAHAVVTSGGGNIDVSGLTVTGVYGDCIKITGGTNGVNFHDNTCTSVGRNGVSIISASNVTAQRNAIPKAGYCTFDIEPNSSSQSVTNAKFLNNTTGTYTDCWMAADGAVGSIVNGVTISGNQATRPMVTFIDLARRQNVTITNNTSTATASGAVLHLAHIDGLTVTGNVQQLSSGQIASITDSTNVTYYP